MRQRNDYSKPRFTIVRVVKNAGLCELAEGGPYGRQVSISQKRKADSNPWMD
jgi:hypothetical protein